MEVVTHKYKINRTESKLCENKKCIDYSSVETWHIDNHIPYIGIFWQGKFLVNRTYKSYW